MIIKEDRNRDLSYKPLNKDKTSQYKYFFINDPIKQINLPIIVSEAELKQFIQIWESISFEFRIGKMWLVFVAPGLTIAFYEALMKRGITGSVKTEYK